MCAPIGRSRAQVEDGGGAVGAVEDFTTGARGDGADDARESIPGVAMRETTTTTTTTTRCV